MAELLHEYWTEEGSGWFGPVSEWSDRDRAANSPDARLVFSLRAASWFQAMQAYQARLDYGDYVPPEDAPDIFYTDDERAKQDAYLAVRQSGPVASGSDTL